MSAFPLRGRLAFGLLAAAVAGALLSAGAVKLLSGGSPEEQAARPAAGPVAVELLAVDTPSHRRPTSDDERLQPYEQLLRRIANGCALSPSEVGQVALAVRNDVRIASHHDVSTLDVMLDVSSRIVPPRADCTRAFAVTQRELIHGEPAE